MEDRKLISTGGVFFDLVLTLFFGVFMTMVCSEHAPPMTSGSAKVMIGAFTAVPITGTFWLALNLFRVTVVDMVRRRKQGKDY